MISWIATSLSLFGIILNAKKNILCWPIWIISNIFWLYYVAFINKQPSQIVLWFSFLIANIYGFLMWKNKQ